MMLPWQLRKPPDPLKYSKTIGGLGAGIGGIASGIASSLGPAPNKIALLKRILTGVMKGTAVGGTQGLAAGSVTDLVRQRRR